MIPGEAEFWANVSKTERGCWLWNNTEPGHYGVCKIFPGMRAAHRIAWFLLKGYIPHGWLVCHGCDNPPCINPDHLFLGTHQDNMDDCMARGRRRHAGRRRRSGSSAKPAMRLMYSYSEAARMIGVSRITFYKIRKLGKIPYCEGDGLHGIMRDDLISYLKSINKTEQLVTL